MSVAAVGQSGSPAEGVQHPHDCRRFSASYSRMAQVFQVGLVGNLDHWLLAWLFAGEAGWILCYRRIDCHGFFLPFFGFGLPGPFLNHELFLIIHLLYLFVKSSISQQKTGLLRPCFYNLTCLFVPRVLFGINSCHGEPSVVLF